MTWQKREGMKAKMNKYSCQRNRNAWQRKGNELSLAVEIFLTLFALCPNAFLQQKKRERKDSLSEDKELIQGRLSH